MGGRKSDTQIGGYKGVECQSLEKEIYQSTPNPFRVVGGAKISRSGQSLSIQINGDDGRTHHFTVLLLDINNLIEERNRIMKGEHITPNIISVREYDNPVMAIKE